MVLVASKHLICDVPIEPDEKKPGGKPAENKATRKARNNPTVRAVRQRAK